MRRIQNVNTEQVSLAIIGDYVPDKFTDAKTKTIDLSQKMCFFFLAILGFSCFLVRE